MISILILFASSILTYIWSLPSIVGWLLGLQLYKFSSKLTVILVLKKLPKRSTIVSDGEMRGWIWGWPYIGYITETCVSSPYGSAVDIDLHIYTTKKFHDSILKNEPSNEMIDGIVSPLEEIDIVARTSANFFNIRYSVSRKLEVQKFNAFPNQVHAIDEISAHYKNNKHTVAYLYGEPGCGKSTIPILLAKKLKGALCITFNPTDPGDILDLIYNSVCPSYDKPLIIVFEEADIMITRIHNNLIERHKHTSIQIFNKTTFNTFFDWIDRGLYPNMILIMTSNKPDKYIDSMDVSYLRNGRTNLRIEISSSM